MTPPAPADRPAPPPPASGLTRALVRLRVPLGFLAGPLYLLGARPSRGSLAAALPLILAGLAVRVWASGSIDKNRSLATAGPYAHVRHPLYLGSALLVLGFALASRSWPLGVGLAVAFLLVYGAVVRREEERLDELFGTQFGQWRRAVPRLLPRLTPWEGGRGAFRWEAVRRHGEVKALAGALLLLGFLVLRVLYGEG